MLRRGQGFGVMGFGGLGRGDVSRTTILTRLFGSWESMAVQDLRF